MNKLGLTTTQLLLVITLNTLFFLFWYFTTPVRIETKIETKTVVKTNTVTVVRNDQATFYNQIIEKVKDTCKNQNGVNSWGINEFHLDAGNKPVFTCKF